LGWRTLNCFYERFGREGTLGRENSAEVVLIPRLCRALERLNPRLPAEAVELAVEVLVRDRSAMSLANANREIYRLLKDGVKVTFQADGMEKTENVKAIDWTTPRNNDYLLASQESCTSAGPIWWDL